MYLIGYAVITFVVCYISFLAGKEAGYWTGYERSEKDWQHVLKTKGLIEMRDTQYGKRMIWK